MPDLDHLRRTFSRIAAFDDFRPDQRVWWIEVRNAAIEVSSRGNLSQLQDAVDQVKEFPEKLLQERERWLSFRDAVGLFLEQAASE